jgi:hypothetical protein
MWRSKPIFQQAEEGLHRTIVVEGKRNSSICLPFS